MSRETSPLRDRMIFLVGARRSGTNWLQRVVGAHPDVALVPSETYLFSRGIAPLRERFHHGVRGSPGTGFVYMDEADLIDAWREFCDRALEPFLRSTPGATRLAERTPEHVTCLELIGRIYPDAHVVHIVRDGRDVVRSLISQAWSTAPRTVEEAAKEWRDCIEAAERASGAIPRYRVVRYEEMVSDPLPHVGDLYAWLGLPTGPGVVEAALDEAEVRFNVDPADAVGAGKWRTTFSPADLAAFSSVAGETLARLGYDTTVVAEGTDAIPSAIAPERPRKRARFRRKEAPGSDHSFERQVSSVVTDTQRLVDRVITAVNTRDLDELGRFMNGTAWIRFVGPDDEWKGRGPAARARLAEVIRADEALEGRQVRGDLYPSLPGSSAIMTYETGDGRRHLRVVAVWIIGDRISRLTYYQLPLAP